MKSIYNSRRQLCLILLLFLLLTGGISVRPSASFQAADSWSNLALPQNLLLEKSSLCSLSRVEATGCLRALSVLLENSAGKKRHLIWENHSLAIANEPTKPGANSSLEQKLNALSPGALALQPFKALFKSALCNVPANPEITANAFDAWLSAIDPHSHLQTAEFTNARSSNETEELMGLGAYFRKFHDVLYTIAVLPGSQAARHGLKANDQIISINGQDIIFLSLQERKLLLQRAADEYSQLSLVILRKNKRVNLSIPGERFPIANVESQIQQNSAGALLVLHIHSFAKDNTCSEAAANIRQFKMQKGSGIVLDLRDNPGGRVDQAICLSGLFLGDGKLVARFKPIREKVESPFRLSPRWDFTKGNFP